jgi:hypothetical protein
MPLNLDYWTVDENLGSELADIFAVPKEKRETFRHRVMEIGDWDGFVSGSFNGWAVRKGDPTFKEAEYHIRGLLSALKKIPDADAPLVIEAVDGEFHHNVFFGIYKLPADDLSFLDDDRPGSYEYTHIPVGKLIFAVLNPLGKAFANLVGRDDRDSNAKNPILNGVIREVRTWPKQFGSRSLKELQLKDHRSKKLTRVFDILHKIHPNIVPKRVPPSTIRDVWYPRKDVRKR